LAASARHGSLGTSLQDERLRVLNALVAQPESCRCRRSRRPSSMPARTRTGQAPPTTRRPAPSDSPHLHYAAAAERSQDQPAGRRLGSLGGHLPGGSRPPEQNAEPRQRDETRRLVGSSELGISAVRDRIVQTAAKLVLEPIFAAGLCPTSFGFRPGDTRHQASPPAPPRRHRFVRKPSICGYPPAAGDEAVLSPSLFATHASPQRGIRPREAASVAQSVCTRTDQREARPPSLRKSRSASVGARAAARL
jgi:hypothetical protein